MRYPCISCNFLFEEGMFDSLNPDSDYNICNHCAHNQAAFCECGYRWRPSDTEEFGDELVTGPCPCCGSVEAVFLYETELDEEDDNETEDEDY